MPVLVLIRICFADILGNKCRLSFRCTGYDPNILGRSFLLKEFVLPVPKIKIERMVLTGLSAQTHGNACGIGAFDVITRQAFERINFEDTYANCVSVKCPEDGKIPLVAETEAVRVAAKAIIQGG